VSASRSLQEASQGDPPKPWVPGQAQTQRVLNDKVLHDHRGSHQGQGPQGRPREKADVPFTGEKAVMSIYSGPIPHESQCKLKLTSQAVNAVCPATPEYIRWSESPITFNRTDHSDSIPKFGRFQLMVDPLVRTTRLTKALMDGGNGLNLMYLDTFEGLGLTWDQLKSSPHPFYRVVPGKQFVPLRKITLPVTFEDVSNYRTKTLAFEVVDFSGPYHVILGDHIMSSSWPSLAMPTSSSRYPDPPMSSLWSLRLSKHWIVSTTH
jgi:hypothetical protein